MKHLKTLFGVLCWLLLATVGCKDELPQSAKIEKGKESVAFTVGTGTSKVKIETSHPWTAKSSQSWLTVSPSKGEAGQGELTLTVSANTTSTARSATVTVKVGHKEATIKVSQAQKESLVLDRESEAVAWVAGTCQFTVSTNVDNYVVESDASWLRKSSSQAKADQTVTLEYDQNDDYEQRIAKVTVKRDGLTPALFTVTQGGRGALYFVLERDEVAPDATEYALKLMKNTDSNGLELIDDVDWLSISDEQLRAMPAEETVMLTLLPNTSTTPREARLVVNDETTGTLLTDTFTLVQQALTYFLRPGEKAYDVQASGQTLSVPVEASGEFNVKLEADAATWITEGPEGPQQPGTLQFVVAENTQTEPRTTTVTLSLTENPEIDTTFTITQVASDVPPIDRIPKLYNLSSMATTIETEPISLGGFKATVSYDTGNSIGWLTNINNNNGKLHFEVSHNTGAKRSATINLVPERGEPIKIRVNQSGNDEAYIQLEEPGTLASQIDFKHPELYKKISLSAPKGINEDDYNTLKDERLAVEEINLEEVKGLTELPDGVFKGNKKLRKLILPASVTKIGAEAFAGCSALEEVPVSSSLKSIGKSAFAGAFSANSLMDIDLTTTQLTDIEEGAFENCNMLSSIKLPDALKTLGNRAFSKCSSLRTLNLPTALTTIGSEAFQFCSSLEGIDGTLTLPTTLTTLGERAFTMCMTLTKLEMSATSLTAIGEEVFMGCIMLGSVDGGSLVIPSGVKRIGQRAFYNTGMKEVDLPETLEAIERNAFYSCKDLKKVICRNVTPPTLDANNPEMTFGIQNTQGWLSVPPSSVGTYENDASWKKATNGWSVTGM